MGHNYIGTEHLLLALFGQPEGSPPRSSPRAGATHADVKAKVVEMLVGFMKEVAAGSPTVVLAHERSARVAAVDVAEERREDVVAEELLERGVERADDVLPGRP